MKTKQAPIAPIQSIDTNQLDAVTGGCGQANCNCTNGSCGLGTPAQGTVARPRFGWAR